MKIKKLVQAFALGALLMLAGCAHVARHYAPPDATAMEASEGRGAGAVAQARATAATVAAKIEAHGKTLEALKTDAAALLRAAPPELRPQVEALAVKVQDAENENLDLRDANGTLRDQVDAAVKALDQAKAERAKYEAEANALTARANAAEQAWDKDSHQLLWMKVHWFIGVIVLVAGIALCAVVAFLKFTGRLAAVGAQVASKIP